LETGKSQETFEKKEKFSEKRIRGATFPWGYLKKPRKRRGGGGETKGTMWRFVTIGTCKRRTPMRKRSEKKRLQAAA